jgi:putative ubiquitin-RnfH superfamily antitoxin RatB of RatAB toxin-antitoxin module
MKVEVAYALAERQWLVAIDVAVGTTAGEAVAQSGLVGQHPALAAGPLHLALFGRVVATEQALREGDRVEVLRPLVADPKEVRRSLAAEGKVMGRRRPG